MRIKYFCSKSFNLGIRIKISPQLKCTFCICSLKIILSLNVKCQLKLKIFKNNMLLAATRFFYRFKLLFNFREHRMYFSLLYPGGRKMNFYIIFFHTFSKQSFNCIFLINAKCSRVSNSICEKYKIFSHKYKKRWKLISRSVRPLFV